MRKALTIALGLASLGAFASVQPASALSSTQSLPAFCRTQNIKCNTDTHGKQVCATQYLSCLHPSQLSFGASGPGPAPDQSQRRNIRAN